MAPSRRPNSFGIPRLHYQKSQRGEKKIKIEFEYRSSNFKKHGHDFKDCDWIVCWEHDWPDAPAKLQIVELRCEFGLGFNVWIVPVRSPFTEDLCKIKTSPRWSVPSQANQNDLILFYSAGSGHCIEHVFILLDRAHRLKAGWKEGYDYMAPIKKICTLKSPIYLEELRVHKILRTSAFVRAGMQGRPNVSEYWPWLYEMITKRNKSLIPKLRRYAPENC